MDYWPKKIAFPLVAPLMSLGLLAAIFAQASTHETPDDAQPYHAEAKKVIQEIPWAIGDWVGREEQVPLAAVQLLKPNIIFSRSYFDNRISSRRNYAVNFLIVQCSDTRDMGGHYPPICYPAHGEKLISETPRDFKAADMTIPVMEYEFHRTFRGQLSKKIVCNFMIVPGRGIFRDIKGVRDASEDYQQRYYGAAQFQLVMPGDVSLEDRQAIFAELVGPNTSVIKTLEDGGIQK